MTNSQDYGIITEPRNIITSSPQEQRAIAEVQGSILIAQKNKRNVVQCWDNIRSACSRWTLAYISTYRISRGGREITGPSIRLVETIAQIWGNIHYGFKQFSSDSTETCGQVYVWDLETNAKITRDLTIKHVRYYAANKKKNIPARTIQLIDPRDINDVISSNVSRTLRVCLLKIIPGDIVEDAVKLCEATLKNTDKVTKEDIIDIIDLFANLDVSKKMVENFISRRVEKMRPMDLIGLKKIYSSVIDGMSKTSDWFDQIDDTQKKESVSQSIISKVQKKKQEEKPEHMPEPTPEVQKQIDEMFGREPQQELLQSTIKKEVKND